MKLQLLSRVKSIFRSKPEAVSNPQQTRAMSEIYDNRLASVYSEIEEYLTETYGVSEDDIVYGNHANGVSLKDKSPTFGVGLAILNQTHGLYNLPDNVMCIFWMKSDNGEDWTLAEGYKLIKFLAHICVKYRIQHLSFPSSKPSPNDPNVVKEADVTCYRLYNVSPSNTNNEQ